MNSATLFYLLCRREEAIRAIEEEIRGERRVADEIVQQMPAAKQEKYFTMTTANEELLQVLKWPDVINNLLMNQFDFDEKVPHNPFSRV